MKSRSAQRDLEGGGQVEDAEGEFDKDEGVKHVQPAPVTPPPSAARPGSSVGTIAAVVTFYFVTSISLVFLNKALLKNFEFELPLFMTWYQLIVALVAVGVMGWLGQRSTVFSLIPPLEFDWNIARHIAPLTIVFVAMIAFSNLTLRFAAVSFYQVVRSLTICFSIVFTWMLLNKTTSWRAIQACIVVIIGFAMGVKGEADVEDFSWLSVFFGVGSSVFVALYGIYVRKVNPYVDDNEWRLIIYNTILAIFMLFPLVFVSGELDMLAQSPLLFDAYFWFVMTFTGVIGILINIATFLQIKHTSPLTHNLSGTAKACLQTALSVLIWQNTVTTMNALGIVLVFAGSFWYSHIRYTEMQEQKRREAEEQNANNSGGR